ncbi:MAG TPA: hypothetical protein VL333_13225 [Candidatus Saccharimonadales bacterium]|jgi:hypothetical protein|nr:hypothetical protein [Candidatus Saccharimonadales bacterium]
MSRYSLNLRPIYDPGEADHYQNATRAIGAGLQMYNAKLDADRAEQNQMAQIGATPVESRQVGPMDRLRSIGSAIKKRLRLGNGAEPNAVATDYDNDAGNEGDFDMDDMSGRIARMNAVGTSAMQPSQQGNAPTAPPVQIDAKGRVAGTNRFPSITDLQPTAPFVPTDRQPAVNPALGVAQQATPGTPAPGPSGRPQTIGDAIKPYLYHGRNGQDYQVDPMYQARIGVAGHELEADAQERRTIATEQRKRGEQTQSQTEAIQALIDAGMKPGEARARVLTNTVKYDEVYGPQRGQMTFDERQRLQKQRDDAAYTRAQLIASGQQNTAAYHQAELALSNAELALKMADTEAAGHDRAAAAAQKDVPANPVDRAIATATPEGAKRVASAESTASTQRAQAESTRAGGVRAAAAAAAPARTGKFTPEQTQSRARMLKDRGYDIWQIYDLMQEEGYNVAKPRTPRPAKK